MTPVLLEMDMVLLYLWQTSPSKKKTNKLQDEWKEIPENENSCCNYGGEIISETVSFFFQKSLS